MLVNAKNKMDNPSTYENDALFRARNTVKEAKYPVFRPMVWHVLAYDRFSCDKGVKAQPVNVHQPRMMCTMKS